MDMASTIPAAALPDRAVDGGGPRDGIRALVRRTEMCESARKLRDTYERVPGAPLFKREFGYYSLERWAEEGMRQDVPRAELFDFDPPGSHSLGELGWCEAGFQPRFEEKVLEVRDDRHGARAGFRGTGRVVFCRTPQRFHA